MKALWKKYADKLDAMTLRERLMVFGAATFVVVYIILVLYIQPAQDREKTLVAQMQQQQLELKSLQQQIQSLEQRVADPDATGRARRDDLSRQIAQIDEGLKGMQQSLVPAQRMNTLLRDMLSRNSRLHLISMRTLPLSNLVEGSDKATDASPGKPIAGEGNVFKHGVEITLSGSYVDLHDYLAQLEKLPWHMLWSRAILDAADYPRVTLTLTVYTLSLDKALLEV